MAWGQLAMSIPIAIGTINNYSRYFLGRNSRFLFLIIIILFSKNIYAQNDFENKISVEINSGISVGWWIYNKGWESSEQHLGYDRTHLAFLNAVGASFAVESQGWSWGVELQNGWLDDRVMITSEEQRGLGSRSRYRIVNTKMLHYQRLMLSVNPFLYSRADGKFKTGPSLSLGIFRLNDTHPQHDRFGFQLSTIVGWKSIFRPQKGHWHISVFPYFSKMRTFVKQPLKRESLYLMDLGFRVGFGFGN